LLGLGLSSQRKWCVPQGVDSYIYGNICKIGK
jgi:hypothetical protein